MIRFNNNLEKHGKDLSIYDACSNGMLFPELLEGVIPQKWAKN